MKRLKISFISFILAGLTQAAEVDFHSQVKPLLSKYCITCHNDKDRKAKLSYEGLGEKDFLGKGDLLEDMQWVVEEHEMPPPKAKAKPGNAERKILEHWIESQLLTIANMSPDDPGIVAMPRLTSSSYDRAIAHLSGLDLGIGRDLLPRDGVAGEGFNNVGAAQGMPPSQLESYLEAARDVVEHVRIDPVAGLQWAGNRVGTITEPEKARLELSNQWVVLYNNTINGVLKRSEQGARSVYQTGHSSRAAMFAAHLHGAWRYRYREQLGLADAAEVVAGMETPLSEVLVLRFFKMLETPHEIVWAQQLLDAWQALPGPDAMDEKEAVAGINRMVEKYWPYLQQLSHNARGLEIRSKRYEDYNVTRIAIKKGSRWPMVCDVEAYADKDIWLLVTDAGDGNEGDFIDWQDGRVTFADGSSLAWVEAGVRLQGQDGKALALDENGRTRVQAPSVVTLTLPAKARQLAVTAACADPDNTRTSVQPIILGERPSPELVRFMPGRGVLGHPKYNEAASIVMNKHYRIRSFSGRLDNSNVLKSPWAYFDGIEQIDNLAVKEWGRRVSIKGSSQFGANPAYPYNPSPDEIVAMMTAGQKATRARLLESLLATVELDEEQLQLRALKLIEQFATKAWSRPIHEAELSALSGLYAQQREAGIAFDASVKEAIVAILVSPQFLYQDQTVASPTTKAGVIQLSPRDLARRMSFALWGSLPDRELLDALEQSTGPETLAAQTRRMLRDPKVEGMAEEFFGQWFGFAGFDETLTPDQDRFPDFDEDIAASMYAEALGFTTGLLRHDRPITDLVSANYAYLDPRLVRHYGINDKVVHAAMKPGTLTKAPITDERRGGILSMGTTLVVTSSPLRTSPVMRGDWLVERLLGYDLPPPPDDVPPLSDDVVDDQGRTIAEQLAMHRDKPACAGCHSRIDPPGLAMENFDPVGRWRTGDGTGNPIASTTSIDGKEVDGIVGLKRWLLEEKQRRRIAQSFCRHLCGYALGRKVLVTDQPLLERMEQSLHDNEMRPAPAIQTLISSPQFRQRRNQEFTKGIKK